jgi:hypothetical protein
VPCPLFLPDQPKGGYFPGRCSADPLTEISFDKLRLCCNRGYARAVCAHAATAEADAAQLLIQSDREGVVSVAWSLERNHHPLSVGVIAVTSGQATSGPDTPRQDTGTPLETQARALVSAYMHQKAPTE